MVEEKSSVFDEQEEKAAFNQSQNITEILGKLLGAYIVHMNSEEYSSAVKVIRRIHDIVSAKMTEEEDKEVDDVVEKIEISLPEATKMYTNNGKTYYTNIKKKREIEWDIERKLFRKMNKLQDKYGYGMVNLDDPRFAVLKR